MRKMWLKALKPYVERDLNLRFLTLGSIPSITTYSMPLKKYPSLTIIIFTFFYQLSAYEAFSFLSNQSKYFNSVTLHWRKGNLTSRGICQDPGKSIANPKVVNLAQQCKTSSFPNQIQKGPIDSLSLRNKFGKPTENPLFNITLFLAFFFYHSSAI